MRVRDLLAGAALPGPIGNPEMDPLTEEDALREAWLTQVVFDAVNMRAGLLFDLRNALQLRTAFTGLLVLRGVEELSWNNERRDTIRTAWNVDASEPASEGELIHLRLLFFPDATMTVAARSAAFYAGNVPGLSDTPPNFTDSDQQVSSGMASMDSPFEPTQATFIEPLRVKAVP